MARIVGILPARYASTRLPGKMLLDLGGKPLILHTYTRATQACLLDRVIVATDDQRIVDVIEAAGGEAVLTTGDHRSGSDRIAEVAAGLECDIVVNVQGDEILIEPALIDATAQLLLDQTEANMSTLACPITSEAEYLDRHVVKVVVDRAGRALYFSRAPIPHSKAGTFEAAGRVRRHRVLRHIGLYGFRRDFLLEYTRLAPTPLEQIEDLEQLRALEHGAHLVVGIAEQHARIKIDTLEELEEARSFLCRNTSS